MKKKLCRIVPLVLIFSFLLLIGACADNHSDRGTADLANPEQASSEPAGRDNNGDITEPPSVENTVQVPEDVSTDDWFYRHVMAGIRFGIIQGASEEGFHFDAESLITRAEFITMLGRMHEYGNEPIGTPGEGASYERYLNWAAELGIILGDENGDLMPQATLTREQMIVIVYRYLEEFDLWRAFYPPGGVTLEAPADSDDMSILAWRAWNRLRSVDLVFFTIGNFYPCAEISRAEGLQILIRASSAIYDGIHPFPSS